MEDRGVPILVTLGFVSIFAVLGFVALLAIAFVLMGIVS